MSVLDIKIHQDWGPDGYTFKKEVDKVPAPEPEDTPVPQTGGVIPNPVAAIAPVPQPYFQGTLEAWGKNTPSSLINGVLQVVSQVSTVFEVLEFQGVQGNSLHHSGGASALTTYAHDCKHQNTQQFITEVAQGAKSVGRTYLHHFSSAAEKWMMHHKRYVTCGALNFQALDDALDMMPGDVDFFLCHYSTMRKLRNLFSTTPITEMITLPSGRTTMGYRSVPFLRSDYCSQDSIICAQTDQDKNRVHGVVGLFPVSGSIALDRLGPQHHRLKMYAGTAIFSQESLAGVKYDPNA